MSFRRSLMHVALYKSYYTGLHGQCEYPCYVRSFFHYSLWQLFLLHDAVTYTPNALQRFECQHNKQSMTSSLIHWQYPNIA